VTAILADHAVLSRRAGDTHARLRWSPLLRSLPLLVIAMAAIWATVATPYRTAGPAIRSDGYGYHAWTRAIVTGDLSFCDDQELVVVQAISAVDPERGVCQNRYPPGMALLRLPVTGWLVDGDASDPRPSAAEHRAALWLGAATLVATAALVADAARRLGVGAAVVAVALVTGTFGTGLFHYSTYDASFSHGTSGLLVAGLCWVGARSAARGAPLPAVPVAALTFAITLTRNTNIVIVGALLLGWLAWQRVPARHLGRLAHQAAPPAVGFVVAMAVQVLYNRYATGGWTISSYGDGLGGSGLFHFDDPHHREVLASYDRGLLTWYPVIGVGFVALLLTRTGRRAALWAALVIAPLALLYGFWFAWSLGGGFGHRGFVEIVPALMLLFAVGLQRLNRPALVVSTAAMVVATLACVSLMAGYWRGSVSFGGTTRDVYWAHVLGEESLYRR
jgi:hypothetical protein